MSAPRWLIPMLPISVVILWLPACAGDDGADGTSCTVSNSGGEVTIVCDDGTSVTVPAGQPGQDGTNCTVTDNGDGTTTIACDDGTTATVSDGDAGAAGADGANCTVTDNGDGTKTISCDDGTNATVSDGEGIDPATLDGILAQLDEPSNVGPESCVVCHKEEGEEHQAIYNDYRNESDLSLTIDSVVSSDGDGDGTYDVVVTFTILKGNVPYIDVDGYGKALTSLEQMRFYAVQYDSATMTYDRSVNLNDTSSRTLAETTITHLGNGQYAATTTDAADYAPESSNGHVYGYIADEVLDTESGGHVHMYDNVANAAMASGSQVTTPYASVANVSACATCHGEPYMKHGYRDPVVEGLGDFASCKSCHYDTRNGGHEDWQILVDDPLRYAEIHAGDELTAEEEERYAYKATLMNDVHMAHAMEFPYPQSMSNCATCHEGHLDEVFANENFVRATCASCHPWTGSEEYGTADRALETIWERAGVGPTHSDAANIECNTCHTADVAGTDLEDLHNGGYNPQIYSFGGEHRYSEVFSASIDDVSFNAAANVLNVKFSATEAGGAGTVAELDADDMVPTLIVGLYGYDTKDFIVPAHGRDADRNRLLEFVIGTDNPRATVITASGGNWEVDVDLSMWSDMLDSNVVRRAEIALLPTLTMVVGEEDADVGTCDPECGRGFYCGAGDACVPDDDFAIAVNAPSRTFEFVANDFDDAFFSDIVDVNKCNVCHDALATTFHSANRGGNIRVCRTCHVGLNAGSHLEMQSRSIDSYVHAVHSFQAFDPGDIDFADPVEAVRYELHVEHTFPNFTIKNCEACHNPGTYNPPDQSRSLAGLLSPSDDVDGRAIHDVPSMVVGPGARACGGCHRADYINDDDFAGLLSFFQHTTVNGYAVEAGDGVLETVIDTIMSNFE